MCPLEDTMSFAGRITLTGTGAALLYTRSTIQHFASKCVEVALHHLRTFCAKNANPYSLAFAGIMGNLAVFGTYVYLNAKGVSVKLDIIADKLSKSVEEKMAPKFNHLESLIQNLSQGAHDTHIRLCALQRKEMKDLKNEILDRISDGEYAASDGVSASEGEANDTPSPQQQAQ